MFSKNPATCLSHLKETWPKDGILRVEIVKQDSSKNGQPNNFDDSPKVPLTNDANFETHENDDKIYTNETYFDPDHVFNLNNLETEPISSSFIAEYVKIYIKKHFELQLIVINYFIREPDIWANNSEENISTHEEESVDKTVAAQAANEFYSWTDTSIKKNIVI